MAIKLGTPSNANLEPDRIYVGLRVISPDQNPDPEEDVTFTGPVFHRPSSSTPEPETAEPGTSPTTT
jgi:hypothetical protein